MSFLTVTTRWSFFLLGLFFGQTSDNLRRPIIRTKTLNVKEIILIKCSDSHLSPSLHLVITSNGILR